MTRLSADARHRAVLFWEQGWKIKRIRERFMEEGIKISEKSLYVLVKKYAHYGLIADRKRDPQPSILRQEHYAFIDKAMIDNDELTAYQLLHKLKEIYPELQLHVSLSTVRRARRDLGWVSSTPRYCQLIREINKEKRLKWCQDVGPDNDFEDVVWTDECSVQLKRHSRRCFRKKGQRKRLKPKPKHPLKVHLWGGILCRGATKIIIFTGKLCATRLVKIFETGLIPFVKEVHVYPHKHRLMQDNDPKHSSRLAHSFLESNGIYWWKTPPESPDLNPIENVWGSLKAFLRDRYKPCDLASLICGIKTFWRSLTPTICKKYVHHIHHVIPKVIEENGGPSGF